MRRDYIDMLGDYIPRGQKHFKCWASPRGCLRLSLRSMEALRIAATRGELAALQTLQGAPSGAEMPLSNDD
jgi:hypothetical protein